MDNDHINPHTLPDIYLTNSTEDETQDHLNVWGSDESIVINNLISESSSEHGKNPSSSSSEVSSTLNSQKARLNIEKINNNMTKIKPPTSCSSLPNPNNPNVPNFIVGGAISSSLTSLQHGISDSVDLSCFKTAIQMPMPEELPGQKSLECHTTPSLASVSSFASSKILEWDSGADVGYLKKGKDNPDYYLSALEKMAIRNYALSLISELNNENLELGCIQGALSGSVLKLTCEHTSNQDLDSSQTVHTPLNSSKAEGHFQVSNQEVLQNPSYDVRSSEILETQRYPYISIASTNTSVPESLNDVHNSTFELESSTSTNLGVGFKSGSLNTVSARSPLTQNNTTGNASDTLFSTIGSSGTHSTDSVTLSPSLSSNYCSSTDCHSQIKATPRQDIDLIPCDVLAEEIGISPTQGTNQLIENAAPIRNSSTATFNEEKATQAKTYYLAISEENKEENESSFSQRPDEISESTKSLTSTISLPTSINRNRVDEGVASSFEFFSSSSREKKELSGEILNSDNKDAVNLKNSDYYVSRQVQDSCEFDRSFVSSHHTSRYSASASSLLASDYSIVSDRARRLKRRAKRKAKILGELESSSSMGKIPSRHLLKYITALEKLEKKLAPFLDGSMNSNASYTSLSDIDPYHKEVDSNRRRHSTYTKDSVEDPTPTDTVSGNSSSKTFVGNGSKNSNESFPPNHDIRSSSKIFSKQPVEHSLAEKHDNKFMKFKNQEPLKDDRNLTPSVVKSPICQDWEEATTSISSSKGLANAIKSSSRTGSYFSPSTAHHMSSVEEINENMKRFQISKNHTNQPIDNFHERLIRSGQLYLDHYHSSEVLCQNKTRDYFRTQSADVDPLLTSSRKELVKSSVDFGQMFPSCQDLSKDLSVKTFDKPNFINQETQTEEIHLIDSLDSTSNQKVLSQSTHSSLSTTPIELGNPRRKGVAHTQSPRKSVLCNTSDDDYIHQPKIKHRTQRMNLHSTESSENGHANAWGRMYKHSLPKPRYASSISSVSDKRLPQPAGSRRPASSNQHNVYTLPNGKKCIVTGFPQKSHGWGSISSFSSDHASKPQKPGKVAGSSQHDSVAPQKKSSVIHTQLTSTGQQQKSPPTRQKKSPSLSSSRNEQEPVSKKGIKFTVNLYTKEKSNPKKPKTLSQELLEMNKKKEIFALNEALSLAKPEFISLAEGRRAKICKKQAYRKDCQEQNHEALAVLPDNLRTPNVIQKFLVKSDESPLFSYKSMRIQNKRLFRLLPESDIPAVGKIRDGTKKTNRLMAKVYSQKLRQKTLKGKVSHKHREVITPLR